MRMTLLKNPHEEARARIIWGESWVEVHHWLIVEGGLTEEQAEVIIENIRNERAAEVRWSGLRSLRTGLGFLLVGGIAAAWCWWAWKDRRFSRMDGLPIASAIFFTGWGFHKTVTGIARFLNGRAEGSLTEMD